MPSKKKKYNARFPAGRIKKIMQTDEEIGKVAQAVPVIISRTLELFVESLLKRAMQITSAKNAKTLTSTHMKQCILSESRFDFLKDLVKGIPDVSSTEDEFGTPSGNLSPGTPLSAKVYGSYSGFQFLQSADGSSSRSSGATSQPSTPQPTQPTPPTPPAQPLQPLQPLHPLQSLQPSQPTQPKFYKEIPIGSDNFEDRIEEDSAPPAVSETSVVQHTGSSLSNHCPPLLPIAKAEGNPSLLRTISGRNITQLNELKLSNCIKASGYSRATSEKENEVGEEEEDEDEDEEEREEEKRLEENGYHRKTNSAKTCTIDEDYDT